MHASQTDLKTLLARLDEIARKAGDIAMGYFRSGERTLAEVSYKGGGSPVTQADLAVDRFLFSALLTLRPDAGWVSEETADNTDRLSRSTIVVVDPIDGTLAYARGDDRWAVSIALVENGRPIVGVVHAPALGETYLAGKGLGATLNGAPITVSKRETLEGAQIVAPRGLGPLFEKSAFGFNIVPRTPSLALRLADIASGRNDLAIAAPNSCDWDIAAADLILSEAGGLLSELDGAPLTYNRPLLSRDMLVAAPLPLFPPSLALARSVARGIA